MVFELIDGKVECCRAQMFCFENFFKNEEGERGEV